MLSFAPSSPAEVAILETFVVPRYLAGFAELAVEMLLVGDGARLAHLGCGTGYPDGAFAERAPGLTVVGVDASASALEVARAKAALYGDGVLTYVLGDVLPTSLEAGAFSHALAVHLELVSRGALLAELSRLLYPGGQALLALPMRGSFQELADLLREYALKFDAGKVGDDVELMVARRPTVEGLAEELEAVGLEDVEVELRLATLEFDSGRAFVEDPVTRLAILPALARELDLEDMTRPIEYLRDAIDRYWSESRFELSVNVGCASGRKPLIE